MSDSESDYTSSGSDSASDGGSSVVSAQEEQPAAPAVAASPIFKIGEEMTHTLTKCHALMLVRLGALHVQATDQA